MGLSEGSTYEYYVTSVQGFGQNEIESNPSQTVSALPKETSDINITSITTDKTTHHTGGGEGPSTLTVTAEPEPTSVTWDCSLGAVTGTGTEVTWEVPGGATPQVVTITCTVEKGSNQDSRQLKLYLTGETIKTQYGQSGKYVDFNNCPSNIQPDSPYKAFSEFFDEKSVVLLNKFGVW